MTLLYVLLAIIAYFVYRIYRQRQNEIDSVADEKADAVIRKKEKGKI